MIKDDKLNEILGFAAKATPGNWKAEACHTAECWCKSIVTDADGDLGLINEGSVLKDDADYIASVDPPTIKAMIEELLQLRQERNKFDFVGNALARPFSHDV